VLGDAIGDEVLALIFAACHPLLAPATRAALTLKVVGGLSTAEIARAYLKTEPTIAQHIVRAKRALAEAHVPFERSRGAELAARLASVLEVLYLMFNEDYAASGGPDWMRPALCEEALRRGCVLAMLSPHGSEMSSPRSKRRHPTGDLTIRNRLACWSVLGRCRRRGPPRSDRTPQRGDELRLWCCRSIPASHC